jgi:hypothetical protein
MLEATGADDQDPCCARRHARRSTGSPADA